MRSNTLSLNISLKNSTGTMPSVTGMTPATVMNTGGPEINCFVLSLPVGGVGLSRRVVRVGLSRRVERVGLSRRVERVGLTIGERVRSCMGECVRLLHS